jgi:hypothetical protein
MSLYMFIAHRINQLDETVAADVFGAADGIEFDIRDTSGEIVVQHDPFLEGQRFTEFLKFCPPNKFYIVNVKSEGIEMRAIADLEARGITQFFLLDCSIPMMVKLGNIGERRLAVRFSEYESLTTVESMAPFVSWVWVDVFTQLPLTSFVEMFLRHRGLKLCLVSPELQGQQEKITEYKTLLAERGVTIDAVCSKIHNICLWRP